MSDPSDAQMQSSYNNTTNQLQLQPQPQSHVQTTTTPTWKHCRGCGDCEGDGKARDAAAASHVQEIDWIDLHKCQHAEHPHTPCTTIHCTTIQCTTIRRIPSTGRILCLCRCPCHPSVQHTMHLMHRHDAAEPAAQSRQWNHQCGHHCCNLVVDLAAPLLLPAAALAAARS